MSNLSFCILVVLLKLQKGATAPRVSANTSIKVNHLFVDKIKVITDTSDNEEDVDVDQNPSNTLPSSMNITHSSGFFL